MTRLLVSVRNLEEVRIALDAGVDLIDLKEPSRGALGPVDSDTACRAASLVDERVPLSMALGELSEFSSERNPIDELSNSAAKIDYFKVGLAQCARLDDWQRRLRHMLSRRPPKSGFVAVVYADAEACAAPPPSQIVATAESLGAAAVLVDTAVKNGRGLFDWWSESRLTQFAAEVRRRGMLCVAGGALTIETVPCAAACGVDYAAVRGAACVGSRLGSIDFDQIQAIRAALGRTKAPHQVG